MNRKIIELRAVVQKLVPLLTGKGLEVTQRGAQAFVRADPKTRKPILINIPNIPESATEEFILAIQGFIDHEVAHVLLTDFTIYGAGITGIGRPDPKAVRLMTMHNIIEDTMIEKEIVKIFPGSRYNIANTRKYFLERITKVALKEAKTDLERFDYLIVPMMRALADHAEMQEFMDDGKYWDNPVVKELLGKMSPTMLKALKTAKTTADTLVIATELDAILYPPPPPAPPAPPPPPPTPAPPEKGESEDKPEKKAEEGDGDGERDHSEVEEGEAGETEEEAGAEGEDEKADEADKTAPAEKDEEEEDEGDASDGDASDEEDSKGDDEDDGSELSDKDDSDDGDDGDSSEAQEEAGDDGDDDDGNDGDSSDGDDAAEAEQGDDGGAEGGDDGDEEGAGAGGVGKNDEGEEDGESADLGENSSSAFRSEGDLGGGEDAFNEFDENAEAEDGAGGVGNAAAKSLFDFTDDAFDKADMSSQIGILITHDAIEAMRPGEYKVYTQDADRIEPVVVPDKINDKWVPEMDEETQAMSGKMQKDIERIMASQSHVIRTPGHKAGKLHSPSLFRISQGDPRVFTQKQEHVSKDTAVTLLVDNSGSMHGEKMRLAMISAYALATTLNRVKIAHEVLGFTTGNYGSMPRSIMEGMAEERSKFGIRYDREIPIIMPIYKSFDEQINATVKRRFAYMMNAQNGLQGNVDGECLQYAAARLIKRTEKRKVMLVLSDGQPAGGAKGGPHLKMVVEDLIKSGIECVGIGILDDSVRHYYPNYAVLKKVEDLPGEVMLEIKKLLM